jgi:hypothetical protein
MLGWQKQTAAESIEILTALGQSLPGATKKICSQAGGKQHFTSVGIRH